MWSIRCLATGCCCYSRILATFKKLATILVICNLLMFSRVYFLFVLSSLFILSIAIFNISAYLLKTYVLTGQTKSASNIQQWRWDHFGYRILLLKAKVLLLRSTYNLTLNSELRRFEPLSFHESYSVNRVWSSQFIDILNTLRVRLQHSTITVALYRPSHILRHRN